MTELLRPEPVPRDPSIIEIDGNARYREVEALLTQGRRLCVTDTYGTALALYSWLKRSIHRRCPVRDYSTGRHFRTLFWRLTRPLLVPIVDHRIGLRKAPPVPFLERLYPGEPDFLLSLPDVLGLNGSWQWYDRGVQYPVLDHSLHPFYGVHFSTRSEHLELFDAYLDERPETPPSAADVGAGAGALTFLLLKHGALRVRATDRSPNAVLSLREDLERQGLRDRVDLERADLFGAGEPAALIAFNPPWLPGRLRVPVDAGAYYPPDLFPRFFRAAADRLQPDGRLVVLFSNFAELAGLTDAHPVIRELETGDRFRLASRREKPVAPPSRRRGRDWLYQLRQRERVQLWELARH
jgi:SAM-dependent methyltransferase